jgi:phosphocarrier protein
MIGVTAIVRNEAGIHCRPSALIVKEAAPYTGQITIATASGSCDAKSIMGLLAMGLGPGERVSITVEGPDEAAQAERLRMLFETHFDFPPRPPGQTTPDLIRSSNVPM